MAVADPPGPPPMTAISNCIPASLSLTVQQCQHWLTAYWTHDDDHIGGAGRARTDDDQVMSSVPSY
jgi:hypothetical protein